MCFAIICFGGYYSTNCDLDYHTIESIIGLEVIGFNLLRPGAE